MNCINSEIYDILSKYRGSFQKFEEYFPEEFSKFNDYIINHNLLNNKRKEQLYLYFNSLVTIPKCIFCNEKEVVIKTFYSAQKFCSYKCLDLYINNKSSNFLSKKKIKKNRINQKNIEKYGELNLSWVERFIIDVQKIHGDKYNYEKVKEEDHFSKSGKVCIHCPTHNFDFWQTVNSHKRGSGCIKCGFETTINAKKDTPKDRYNKFIQNSNLKHNNKYDYSLINEQTFKTSLYDKCIKITIICPTHGVFNQSPRKHMSGNGCRKCANESYYLSKNELLKRFKEIHGEMYIYDQMQYTGYFNKIKIFCNDHGYFEQKVGYHLRGRGCKLCHNACSSKLEQKWLDILNIDQKFRNKILKFPERWFSCDAVVGKVVYEFDGDFWHGNPKIYNHNDVNKVTKETFGSLYGKTISKKEFLEKKGYRVISIWESDFIEKYGENI